jgi:hypothetical protein
VRTMPSCGPLRTYRPSGSDFRIFATNPAQYSARGDWIHHPVSPHRRHGHPRLDQGQTNGSGSLVQSYGKVRLLKAQEDRPCTKSAGRTSAQSRNQSSRPFPRGFLDLRGNPLSIRPIGSLREAIVTDFQRVLTTVTIIFLVCAVLAVLLASLDAVYHVPLADFLVKKFGDLLTLCVGAIAGLLAGRHFSRSERTSKSEKSL